MHVNRDVGDDIHHFGLWTAEVPKSQKGILHQIGVGINAQLAFGEI